MILRVILLLGVMLGAWQSASASVVRIADGDCAGLASAVAAAAGNSGTTTILLARNGTYPACKVVLNPGKVLIDGQGAHLQFFSACLGPADAEGSFNPANSLTLRNLSIGSAPPGIKQDSCIVDHFGTTGTLTIQSAIADRGGSLVLESVTLDTLTPPIANIGESVTTSFIESKGGIVLRNVTLRNLNYASAIRVFGSAEIYNSTVAGNANAFLLFKGSRLAVGNSLLSANFNESCDNVLGGITSLGGNVSDDGSCGLSAASGDRIVGDAQLGSFGNHGGSIPTLAISNGSPARDAGVAQYCEALDARGYTRSQHGCDAGAYEYGGGSGALTQSGMNGVFYDPDANGHYVSIQRVRDNGDVAILWSTFDANGNQAWIYGVGQVSGKHIHTAMSQNIGGVLQPGGPPTGSSVRSWGTVDIDLTSCVLAQFNYASALDGFGSGQFPLTRLAFVSDFGCAE